jgi:hypothetical protein
MRSRRCALLPEIRALGFAASTQIVVASCTDSKPRVIPEQTLSVRFETFGADPFSGAATSVPIRATANQNVQS